MRGVHLYHARMTYLLRLTAEHVALMEPERFAVDDLFGWYAKTPPDERKADKGAPEAASAMTPAARIGAA